MMAKLKSDIDYVQYALDIAYDDRYYYAHSSDKYAFSCSTLVGHALYVTGYVKTDPKPRDGHAIGGSVIDGYLKEAGFKRYLWKNAGGLQPGDVLIVQPYHIAFHVKNGTMVAANGNGDMVDRSASAITTYNYKLVGTPQYVWRPTKVHKTMTKTEKATQQMEAWAKDNSHGYDQAYRWGQKGDYDCSSAVITAWELAGVPVKTAGATYTGNIRPVFLANGFSDVTSKVNLATGSGLQRGDVLLNAANHVAMYCGNGKEVEASINEKGGVTGGQPGDQTGKEFLIRSYRNYPWNYVLRYADAARNYLQKGDSGDDVAEMQRMLIILGYSCGSTGADSDFGNNTEKGLKKFQKDYSLTVNGLYDAKSKSKLKSVYKKKITSKWKAVGTATCKNNDIYFRASANSKTKANLLGRVGKGHRFEVDGKKSGKWVHAKHAIYGVGYIWYTYVVYD